MSRHLLSEPRAFITDDWLAKIGFKWHQMDRQSSKHWVLWLGDALADTVSCYSDLGLELACGLDRPSRNEPWYFCWLRADTAGRYHRFLHVRHLVRRADVLELIRGLTGQTFDPDHVWYGGLRRPEQAAHFKQEYDRIDLRMIREGPAWYDTEKDDTRGGPLLEHLHAHAKKDAK